MSDCALHMCAHCWCRSNYQNTFFINVMSPPLIIAFMALLAKLGVQTTQQVWRNSVLFLFLIYPKVSAQLIFPTVCTGTTAAAAAAAARVHMCMRSSLHESMLLPQLPIRTVVSLLHAATFEKPIDVIFLPPQTCEMIVNAFQCYKLADGRSFLATD